MATKTKAKRVRITQKEIDKAREELALTQATPSRPKAVKEKPKWGKEFWFGLVYCDSYGHAWIDNFEPAYLGQSDEFIPYLKSKRVNGENVDSVLIAAKEFQSEKQSQSCHLATENDTTSVITPVPESNRATFKDDPRFLSLLDGLIAEGCGTPTIQKKLGEQGYNIPYRTLGRWIAQRKGGIK